MYRLLIPLVFLFWACGNQGSEFSQSEEVAYATQEMADQASPELRAMSDTQDPATPLPATERRLIRTAELRMQVPQLDTATRQLTTLVSDRGGFIATSEFTNSSYQLTQNLTVRVPADQFATLLTELAQLGNKPDYQRINTLDVTETWVDLESRLATKRAVRERYLEVLRNRAQTAEDILNAEDKIRVVTEEIEAQEARLRALKDRVAYSTIEVELYQQKQVEELPEDPYRVSFWHQVGRAFGDGWSLVKGGVVFLITIWPLWIVLPVFLYAWRRWRNGRRSS